MILSDQDVSDVPGVYVDFFGRPAYTITGPVSLAMHTGAPVLIGVVLREGEGYRIVHRPFELVRTGDRKEEVRVNTQRWSNVIEEWIAQHPEQWPWVHRRWKTTEDVLERKRRQWESGLRRRR